MHPIMLSIEKRNTVMVFKPVDLFIIMPIVVMYSNTKSCKLCSHIFELLKAKTKL